MLGSRGPATRCIARRIDPPAPFCLALGRIHTLCSGDAGTRAQHGLPLCQRNWGAYSSTSRNGEIGVFTPSDQSTLQADVVLTPIAAYNVDILHGRSAEAFAVTRYEVLDSRVQVHLLSIAHAFRRAVITIARFDTVSPHLRQRHFCPSSTASVCWRQTRLPPGLHG